MTNEKILLQLEKGYDIKNPLLAQALSNLEDKIGITKAELEEAIETKANLVGGKVPAEELPSYVDDVIEFNNIQVADAEISSIIGNNLYKNQIRFVNNSTTLPDRIGSEDKYPNMFVNFGENTSEDDWTTFEPEKDKIYINTTNNHSYRWSGSYLIDLDFNWSQGIEDLQENTVRTDSQDLSVVQQKQAFENLGMKVYVTDSSFLGSTLSAEEIEEVFVSKAILFADTGDLFSFGAASSLQIYFYKFINRSSIGYIMLNKPSGLVSNGSFEYQDVTAVRFTAQNPALTSAQQEQAWLNLGLDLVILKFPKGVTSITLTDEEDAKLQSGAAVLVTTDSTDTTGNIYNANNHIFTTIDSKNTSQPLYYSLALFSGLLYCSYDRVSKKFTYQGIIRLLDTGAVRFDRTTTLAASQKDTALSNIGLGFVIVDYSELSTTLSDDRLSQLVNAKGFILTNTPDNYTRSVVFTAGTRLVNSITFSSIEDFQDINYIVLNIPNKALSLVQTSKLIIGNFNQNLTNTEKDTVLSNIGLDFVHVDYSLLETTLTDEMFAVLNNAKSIILVGLPSNYYNPVVFIKGNNTSTGCIFVGFATGNKYCQIKLDKSTKILSNINANSTYIGTVRYIEKQSLTDTQKQQARTNIGVKSADELLEDADFIAQLKTKLGIE